MIRGLGPALAVLLSACGAAPSAMPEPHWGPLPDPALRLTFIPDAVGDALAALDAHLAPGLDALGPLGAAFARARQDAVDTLLALAPGGARAPALVEAWGLVAGAPLRVTWATADEGQLARRLLDALTGQRPEGGALPPVWQLRVELLLDDPGAAAATLDAVVARLGWSPGGPWPGLAPPGLLGWARDPEGGALLTLRGRSPTHPGAQGWGAVDLVIPSTADTSLAILAARLPAGGGEPPRAPAGLLQLEVSAAGLAAAEAAVGGAAGLLEPPGARRAAAAELLGACVEAWAGLAALSGPVEAALEIRGGVLRATAGARLSAEGAQAWGAAHRPLPLPRGLPSAPGGVQLGLASAAFSDPGLSARAACRLSHPALVGLAWLPAFPAVFGPEALPLPTPPHGWGPGPTEGRAALLLGASAVEGAVTPHLAGLVVGASAGPAPLGEGALSLSDPGGARWVLPHGPLPVSLARRSLGERPVLVFGLGPDAALRVAEAIAQAEADPRFLDGWLDLPGLAAALRGAGLIGAEAEALSALARRVGQIRLTGQRMAEDLRFELRVGELDRQDGGQ